MRRLVGKFTACAALLAALAACSPRGLQFDADGERAYVSGVITTGDFEQTQRFLAAHPEVETLVLLDVPGSVDDDENLRLSSFLREEGLSTELLDSSEVASGGTDLFLAGKTRRAACGAQLGVHSWAIGFSRDRIEGRDLPRDPTSDAHRPYLDFYRTMGIPTEFYWFTLDAAGADDIYYMTAADIERYDIVTEPRRCAEIIQTEE